MKKVLSGRELEVMKILWASEKPLVASEVASADSSLSINTIHSVLKTLLKNKYIKVADIVYSGTVLTRSYAPIVTLADYLKDNFFFASTLTAVSSFIEKENDEEVIDELDKLLKKKRRELGDT